MWQAASTESSEEIDGAVKRASWEHGLYHVFQLLLVAYNQSVDFIRQADWSGNYWLHTGTEGDEGASRCRYASANVLS